MTEPAPGFEKEWRKKAKKTNVWFKSIGRGWRIRGHLSGAIPQEVAKYYERFYKCTCGGKPRILETESMGDFDIAVTCQNCGRRVYRSMYDWDCKHPKE